MTDVPAGPLAELRAGLTAHRLARAAFIGCGGPDSPASVEAAWASHDARIALNRDLADHADFLLACAAVVESVRTQVPVTDAELDALAGAYPVLLRDGLVTGLAHCGVVSRDQYARWFQPGRVPADG